MHITTENQTYTIYGLHHHPQGDGMGNGGVSQFVRYITKHLNIESVNYSESIDERATANSIWIVNSADIIPEELYQTYAIILTVRGMNIHIAKQQGNHHIGLDVQLQHRALSRSKERRGIGAKLYSVATSKQVSLIMKEHIGFEADKVIMNPIDIGDFKPALNRKPGDVLVIGGRFFHRNKGAHIAHYLREQLPHHKFIIREMNDIKPSDRRAYYQGLDMWLGLSLSEGFGYCAGEAMSCNIPLVSTDAGFLGCNPELNDYHIGNIFSAEQMKENTPIETRVTFLIEQLNNMYDRIHSGEVFNGRDYVKAYLNITRWKRAWTGLLKGVTE